MWKSSTTSWCQVPPLLHAAVTQFVSRKHQFLRSLGRAGDHGVGLHSGGVLHVAVGISGELFVSDSANHCVHVLSAVQGNAAEGGVVLRRWGLRGHTPGNFLIPHGIAVVPPGTGPHEGEVLVADCFHHRVQVFRPDGTFLRMWGFEGTHDGQLKFPQGVAATPRAGPSGGIEAVVVDTANHRVQVFRLSDGVFLRQWGAEGSADGQFADPRAACVACTKDESHGLQVLVSDRNNHRVQVFSLDGVLLRQWGSYGTDPGQFNRPGSMAVCGDEVLVADTSNHRVQVFRVADGAFLRLWNSEAVGHYPDGMAATPMGHVLVSDTFDAAMRVFQ